MSSLFIPSPLLSNSLELSLAPLCENPNSLSHSPVNSPSPSPLHLRRLPVDLSMVAAKLSIPSDDEGSPQNPSPPSPPSPPAGKTLKGGRRLTRPIPPPRSDPLGRMRRRRPRRERGAKLEEYPDSPPPSPTPPRKTLDLGVTSPSAPALPVPAAPPSPDRSDPKKWRWLPDYFYRYRILPSWATVGGGVEAAGSSEAAPCTVDTDGLSCD